MNEIDEIKIGMKLENKNEEIITIRGIKMLKSIIDGKWFAFIECETREIDNPESRRIFSVGISHIERCIDEGSLSLYNNKL